MQWLVDKPSLASGILGYGFLVFAFLTWPIYIPYVMKRLEKKKHIKRILKWLHWLGAFVSAYLLAAVLQNGLDVLVVDHHIVYDVTVPYGYAWVVAYVIATVGALLVSSNRFFTWFGFVSFVAVALSYHLYETAFVSVWCFFAAILSVLIFAYLHVRPKHPWLKYLLAR